MSLRELYIVRGVAGAGKTTFANTLGCPVFSADDYFEVDGEYRFSPFQLKDAHERCKNLVEMAMAVREPRIAVTNTFTREWEIDPYLELASRFGYKVHSLIVENRHGGENIHNVSKEKVEKMVQRFEIQL